MADVKIPGLVRSTAAAAICLIILFCCADAWPCPVAILGVGRSGFQKGEVAAHIRGVASIVMVLC